MLSTTLRQFKSFMRLRLFFVQEGEAAAAKAVAAKVNTFLTPLTMTIIVVMMTSVIVTMTIYGSDSPGRGKWSKCGIFFYFFGALL